MTKKETDKMSGKILHINADGYKVTAEGGFYTFAVSTENVRAAINTAIVEFFDRENTGPALKGREREALVSLIAHHIDRAYDIDETERRKMQAKT